MSSASVPRTEVGGPTGRFKDWIERRIPPTHRITLSQETVFIFPTLTGFVFGGLVVLLILGAINYQNSLIYGVAFLLGSLFLVTILYTFRNLSGLTIELAGVGTGFVGEDVEFAVRVSRPAGTGREGVQLGWPSSIMQWVEVFDAEASTVKLFVPARARGWLNPGRLLIETYFPLGLLRAWTWVDLAANGLVFPQPIFDEPPESSTSQRDEGALIDPRGSDDFNDMRDYRPGDPVRHIVWRSYARSDNLVVKEYASFIDPRFILDWEGVTGDVEMRLSKLTGMALAAARLDREFGLQIPGTEVPPGVGQSHLETVLKSLALYEKPGR
jgi:uncharacterized protein (DUF58 family)